MATAKKKAKRKRATPAAFEANAARVKAGLPPLKKKKPAARKRR
jgi:hypothetical protein